MQTLLSSSCLKHHRGPPTPKAKTLNIEFDFKAPVRPTPAPAPPAPPTPTWVRKLGLREMARLPRATCLETAEPDSNPGPSGSVPGLHQPHRLPRNAASREFVPCPPHHHLGLVTDGRDASSPSLFHSHRLSSPGRSVTRAPLASCPGPPRRLRS